MTVEAGDKFVTNGYGYYSSLEVMLVRGNRAAIVGTVNGQDRGLSTIFTSTIETNYRKVVPFFEVGKSYNFNYGTSVYTVANLRKGVDGRMYAIADVVYSSGEKSMTTLSEDDFKDVKEA